MSAVSTESILPANMSLRDKIAQLVFVRIGSNLPPVRTAEQDEDRVAKLLDECPVGGLLLFNGGPETKQTLERLQQRSAVPLLVASDIERGVGQQVKSYTLFPHAMAFGTMEESEGNSAIQSFAQTLVHESREVGIHITFGPVADVSTNPRNPIIVTRAFSDDTKRVSQLVALFVNMVQSRGIHATAKHFPGHGDTEKDSHDSLPTVARSREQLASCELKPFQAAIDSGCQLIMTAHVAYPALDPSGTPATLSPIILQNLLRKEMGFEGVICSDSLLMAGVRDRYASEGEIAHAAIEAGVDLLLDVEDPIAVVNHLCRCVADGTLDERRIDESLARVWKLKETRDDIPWEEFTRTSAESVARNAIRLIGKHSRPAPPLDANKSLCAILIKPFETVIDPPEQPLAAALRERFSDVRYAQLGPQADAAAYKSVQDLARNAQQIVLAIVVRPAAWHAFGLLPEQTDFVHRLLNERGDIVLASLGVPYVLQDFPQATVRICTYSDVPVSQQALAEFLLSGGKAV
jgi:beta-N-acetylhexosaminidase